MWINELTQAAVICFPFFFFFFVFLSGESVVQRLTTEVQQHSEQKYISIHCPANEVVVPVREEREERR